VSGTSQPVPTDPAPGSRPEQTASQLNALALVWGMIKDCLSSLFAAKKS